MDRAAGSWVLSSWTLGSFLDLGPSHHVAQPHGNNSGRCRSVDWGAQGRAAHPATCCFLGLAEVTFSMGGLSPSRPDGIHHGKL